MSELAAGLAGLILGVLVGLMLEELARARKLHR